jgi:succinate dehydrogenase / fumarate reductase, iron-sulfur subunit
MAEFRVFRFDPERNLDPHFDKFHVPVKRGMTVLDGLSFIVEELDPTLAFRASCQAGECGSCALHINGRYRLACRTLITDLEAWEITVRPLAHLTVLKDLVVDMRPFWDNWQRVMPFLLNEQEPGADERLQTREEHARIEPWLDCILCGACYAACPTTATSQSYLGPHALLAGLRWIEDSRDGAYRRRLALVDGNYGVDRCHLVFNCQEACPLELDPSRAISKLKKKLLGQGLRRAVGLGQR